MDRIPEGKSTEIEIIFTIDQMDLIPAHPTVAEYTFVSLLHETYYMIDHMVSHKDSAN